MTTKVETRCFKTFSASSTFQDKAMSPTVACASIQLAANNRSAKARASAGLETWRTRSRVGICVPSDAATDVAESLEMDTKLEVSEIVANL